MRFKYACGGPVALAVRRIGVGRGSAVSAKKEVGSAVFWGNRLTAGCTFAGGVIGGVAKNESGPGKAPDINGKSIDACNGSVSLAIMMDLLPIVISLVGGSLILRRDWLGISLSIEGSLASFPDATPMLSVLSISNPS